MIFTLKFALVAFVTEHDQWSIKYFTASATYIYGFLLNFLLWKVFTLWNRLYDAFRMIFDWHFDTNDTCLFIIYFLRTSPVSPSNTHNLQLRSFIIRSAIISSWTSFFFLYHLLQKHTFFKLVFLLDSLLVLDVGNQYEKINQFNSWHHIYIFFMFKLYNWRDAGI